jgi:polysaccharide chain length determinant protein (PEP-CTERM system associated)
MYDLFSQLLEHLRGVWRYRWRALALAWVVALAGWGFVYAMPNQYEVETRVYVDTESTLRPLLKGQVVDTNMMSQVELMSRALLSRPRLEQVARETDLDLRASTPREMENLMESLRRSIRVSRERNTGGNTLFNIRFVDIDPNMAYNVVQALLDSFVGQTLAGERGGRERALRFLREKLASYERQLNEAEAALADFKRANVGRMPGEGGDYYERLQQALSLQSQLEAQLRIATERRDLLNRQISGEEAVFGIVSGPRSGAATGVDGTIAELEAQLDTLRLRYTDKHPDVIAVSDRLDTLYERQREERQMLATQLPDAGDSDRALNPVYQEMRIQLTTAELDVTSLRARLDQQIDEVEELRAAVDTIPEVEAEFKRLTRDYNSTRANYEDYKRRVEVAVTTGEVDGGGDEVQFQVIEPPLAPLSPVAPNRILLLSVVLVVALGAGAALAFFYHQLNPVFTNRRTLSAITGLPVLGSVSLIQTPAERFRLQTQTAIYGLGLMCLIGAWVLTVAFNEQGVELASRMMASAGL